MTRPTDLINDCKFLFLLEIEERGCRLRLVVAEGLESGPPRSVRVGSHDLIHNCTPINVTDLSRAFEISWDSYVAYCVRNESYALLDETERFVGGRFRTYSSSNFMKYIAQSTFATDQYPGPIQHHEVCCEDQLVSVVSTSEPVINQMNGFSG